jgi:hypothetical protein
MASRQQRISSGRLDPKSPYVGNFHRGHSCTVFEEDDEVVDYTRKSSMYRSSSEPNVISMISSADIQELANMELSPDFRNLISSTPKPSDREPSPSDSSKLESIQPVSSSERLMMESISKNSRLNLDGIPSTPELCALQAILPKQARPC